ncbi:MAG: metallophosphoesterase [Oscillospiraceae bacterium]|nr:metallophosphoesterase [Oscillospiraceae bacterium]
MIFGFIGSILLVILSLGLLSGSYSFRWLRGFFPGIKKRFFIPAYALFAVLGMGFMLIPSAPGTRLLKAICSYWFAFYIIFCMILIVAAVCHFIFWLIRKLRRRPAALSRRATLAAGLAVIVLAGGVTVYGSVHAVVLREKYYEVETVQTAGNLESLRIVLVSDIHLGNVIGVNRVRRIAEKINRMDADIVCIAGDIFDGDLRAIGDVAAVQEAFRSIAARYGVYAVPGNHDGQMGDFLRNSDITLLEDKAVTVAGAVTLAGRRDRGYGGGRQRTPLDDILAGTDRSLPLIVLDHQPQPGHIDEARENGAVLMLTGHTHKGQIFPISLITVGTYPLDYGCVNLGGYPLTGSLRGNPFYLVVTSGAGTWGPPLRLGTDSEIVSVTLRFAS